MGVDDVLEWHLAQFPDVLEQLNLAHQAARATVDQHILGACEQRIREILGTATDNRLTAWPSDSTLDAKTKACLAFTEEYMIDVAGLSDDTAAAVRSELGDQAMVDFVSALLIVEQRHRIALTWSTVFGDGR